jgi:tetratricopeptide (TPR) repeat protein
MYSILIGIGASLVTFLGIISVFDKWSAILLSPIIGVATYLLLVRRLRHRVEAAMKDIEPHIKAQRFDRAIQALESLRPLYRWQPLLAASTEGQIGMIKYVYQSQFEEARPFLEKAHPWFWQPRAMLAAGHFKKKRYQEMEEVFERTLKRNEKEPLLWATYAWCQWKRGLNDKALEILGRARTKLPAEERLKNMSLNLGNGKKLKMNPFGVEWYSFHLEPPPGAAVQQAQAGRRQGGFTPPPQAYGRGMIRR